VSGKSTSLSRPEFCPTCGVRIGPLAVIVQINKGPWTCEACDGKTAPQPHGAKQVACLCEISRLRPNEEAPICESCEIDWLGICTHCAHDKACHITEQEKELTR
jgi:hypothetical protein